MPNRSEPDTEQLLSAVGRGDASARGRLLSRHRSRLKRMVEVRLDRRVAARVDPSDIVQDTLTNANQLLDSYVREKPLPFYPWLRRLALLRLTDNHRRHLARRRTVVREEQSFPLPDESVLQLADRLMADAGGPSARLRRHEQRERVRVILDRLPERDREILELRYLEDLPTADAASVLQVSVGTAKVRLLRALRRLRDMLDEEDRP